MCACCCTCFDNMSLVAALTLWVFRGTFWHVWHGTLPYLPQLIISLVKVSLLFFFFFTHSLSTASDIKSACSCSFHVCVSILHWSAAVPPVLLVCRSAPLSLKPVLASYLSLSVGCADELVVSFAKIILPLINSSFNILYMQCSAKLWSAVIKASAVCPCSWHLLANLAFSCIMFCLSLTSTSKVSFCAFLSPFFFFLQWQR